MPDRIELSPRRRQIGTQQLAQAQPPEKLYRVLDNISAQSYQDAAQLASVICNTPIAYVSLVNGNHQWFEASMGLRFEEIQGPHTFCAQTLAFGNTVVISDTLLDSRLSSHPSVIGEPHIRFYAGAPILSRNRKTLGMVCVVDLEPHVLTPVQMGALETLARRITNELSEEELKDEQREASARALETAERLAIAIDAAQLGVYSWEPDSDYFRWENERVFEIYGRAHDQEPSDYAALLEDLVVPEEAASFKAALHRLLSTEEIARHSGWCVWWT